MLARRFLFTAFISVVTGGTSLITVPVMMQLGTEPHVAVATNMLSLIFLSLGGTVPFLKGEIIPRQRLPALIGLTLIGSILGALLLCSSGESHARRRRGGDDHGLVFSLTNSDAEFSPAAGKPAGNSEVAGMF